MKPESRSVSVVLVGSFKPSDFVMGSLQHAKALSASDLSKSTYIALLADQAVEIELPWGKLLALSDRFSVELSQVPYVRAADLVSKCLRDVSPSATVTKVGINVISHYRFANMYERDKFAVRLVPPLAWGTFGKEVLESMKMADDRHGGIIDVTMRMGRPDDREIGWIDARIQQSTLIPQNAGAAVSINDHYECLSADKSGVQLPARLISERLLELVESRFDQAIERLFQLADRIVSGENA